MTRQCSQDFQLHLYSVTDNANQPKITIAHFTYNADCTRHIQSLIMQMLPFFTVFAQGLVKNDRTVANSVLNTMVESIVKVNTKYEICDDK